MKPKDELGARVRELAAQDSWKALREACLSIATARNQAERGARLQHTIEMIDDLKQYVGTLETVGQAATQRFARATAILCAVTGGVPLRVDWKYPPGKVSVELVDSSLPEPRGVILLDPATRTAIILPDNTFPIVALVRPVGSTGDFTACPCTMHDIETGRLVEEAELRGGPVTGESSPLEEALALVAEGQSNTPEEGARMVERAQAEKSAAAIENIREAAERRLDRVDPLHPNGRCTCAGEGACEWCRRSEAAIDRARAEFGDEAGTEREAELERIRSGAYDDVHAKLETAEAQALEQPAPTCPKCGSQQIDDFGDGESICEACDHVWPSIEELDARDADLDGLTPIGQSQAELDPVDGLPRVPALVDSRGRPLR